MKKLLRVINILFFVFAYNLMRCAYYTYLSSKETGIKDIGKIISAYAQNAFYFLLLFIILKFITLKALESKNSRPKSIDSCGNK